MLRDLLGEVVSFKGLIYWTCINLLCNSVQRFKVRQYELMGKQISLALSI